MGGYGFSGADFRGGSLSSWGNFALDGTGDTLLLGRDDMWLVELSAHTETPLGPLVRYCFVQFIVRGFQVPTNLQSIHTMAHSVTEARNTVKRNAYLQ